MAIVTVSSSGNEKTKNKKMEYLVIDRKKKFSNGFKSMILAEEDANELRNHGYDVEENKNVYSGAFNKKSSETNGNRGRHLSSTWPSSTEEYVGWGRTAVFQGQTDWFDQFNSQTPSSVKICVASSGIDIGHEDLPRDRITGLNVSDNPEPWFEDTSGHGTYAAGIIAAIGGNGKGVSSYARQMCLNMVVSYFISYIFF